MRLLDTASFNTDRHSGNYIFQTKVDDEGKPLVTNIRTFDYGDSADIDENRCYWRKYYNDFVLYGDKTARTLTKSQIVDHFKNNQTVQMFLPRQEASEILGSVDFSKQAKDLEEETGVYVSPWMVESWKESFDNMAEELSQ